MRGPPRITIPRVAAAILAMFVLVGNYYWISAIAVPKEQLVLEPVIADMIAEISESEIYNTVYSLQNFSTRVYGYPGNTYAGSYLFERLSNITGMDVEYQGGSLRNVVGTLPGISEASNTVFMVGAHYDSISSDPNNAPGATDNGGGVAIVLELARIMSQYKFNHTLKFALWNREEGGLIGSRNYAEYASSDALNISLYFNYDSACYDPNNRLVLDIMYNAASAWFSDMMTQLNSLYGVGFTLTYNVHGCSSDHISFWERGFTGVMTHQETHGWGHTPQDTVDKVSTTYAKKNGQLGMCLLAELAEVQTGHYHDIAVKDLVTSKTVLAEGGCLNISAIVRNEGDFSETFSLTISINSTTIETETLMLQSKSSTEIDFTWNASSFAKGPYNLTIHVSFVANESDTSDNTRFSSIVITILGDIDADHDVDIYDIVRIACIYGRKQEDSQFDANCDLDDDGDIDLYDIVMAISNYQESWGPLST